LQKRRKRTKSKNQKVKAIEEAYKKQTGNKKETNKGSSSFSMDKIIFNSRPRWFS